MNNEYLYHYTNLQSLALILKTKKIKFNSLINMDDKEEKLSQDVENGGKYCFVSSWTDDERELIPMWSLYSNMAGLRIRMKRYPFVKYIWKDPLEPIQMIESYFDLDELKKMDIFPYIPEHDILYKVMYTNDNDKLMPELKEYVQNGYHINYESLGKFKRKAWEFQKEWRYILYVRPVRLSTYLKELTEGKREYKNSIENNVELKFSALYLSLREECLDDIEILCAPKMPIGDKVILDCLKEKYCPNAIIKESILKIR